MQRSILAVSPNLQFLEQIRSHLEEGGRYRVQGVTSGADALALVRNTYYDLAILDAESSDVPFVPFTRDLVAIQPGLKLLVFPPQNNPHHPVLTGLVTNGFLNKPFFTPEVSRALKNILHEPVEEPEPEPELTTDLAKLWMQRPEMGIKRVEQLLGSTTAQTGLLVSQGKVIAGSGPCEDSTIQMALNLLDLHRSGKESMELIRFIPLESEGGELLIYASQLINDVTLVLFYPPTSSIQLLRQEVYQVKQEFKQAYPTTGELRRDLNVKPNNLTKESLSPIGGVNQPSPIPGTIGEFNEEELIPLEDEIGSDELDSILSNIELKNLDAILADMPSPDPDAEQVVDDESTVAEPAVAPEGSDTSSWIPLSEAEDEKTDSEFATKLTDDTTWMTPPPLPAEFMEQQVTELEAAATIADDTNLEQKTAESTDGLIIDENKEEIIEETPEVSSSLPILDFNLPWESAEQETEIPEQPGVEPEYESPVSAPEDQLLTPEASVELEHESPVSVPEDHLQTPEASVESEYESPISVPEDQLLTPEESVDPKDLEFMAWLDEIIPVSAPIENDGIESTDHAEDVLLPLPDEVQAIESPIEAVDIDDDISSLFTEFEPLTELIEIETELPDDDEEEESVPLVIPTEYEPHDQVLAQDLELIPGPDVIEPEIQNQSAEEPTGSIDLPPVLPLNFYNTNLPSEPGTSPLGIKNFRFHYTCLLIPCNPQQFLTRDLSERLSFLIPQLHLEYGWRLTGITIRPQYMLWSVSLPVDACPVLLVRDIRRRTTAHITSNFTDLTPIGDGDDFWAPGFLILSGYTSPTIGMIADFISQTRMNQSLNA